MGPLRKHGMGDASHGCYDGSGFGGLPPMVSPTEHWYEVRMDPQMDEDMGKLAERLKASRGEVFCRAMRLYVAVKNRELDHQSRIFLEDQQGKKTEIIGV